MESIKRYSLQLNTHMKHTKRVIQCNVVYLSTYYLIQ